MDETQKGWRKVAAALKEYMVTAEREAYERGLEDAAVLVEEVFDIEIAKEIRQLKHKQGE